jgi:hypothetical protein
MKNALRSLAAIAALVTACGPGNNTTPDVVTGGDTSPMDAAMDSAPADAGGDAGPMPNLVPVIRNPQLQRKSFAAGSCEVMEGCTVPGSRRLLRFDLITPNIGNADLYLGNPTPENRPREQFEWGACHNHWHLRGYADYRLVDMSGREVGRGHKQSFCLEDFGPWMGMGAPTCRNRPGQPEDPPGCVQPYTCSNQGIHAGNHDIYDRSLDCQYVDVTDVPPGQYILRARINVDRVVAESNYDDNVAEMVVTVSDPGDAGVSMDPTEACAADEQGPERECGWVAESMPRTCTPGTMVEVGCNAGCSPPLGSCEGDTMIRVCAGDRPCQQIDAMGRMPPEYITQNDDSCGPDNTCSYVRFTCPAGGRYTVMTGSYRPGAPSNCHVATR